MPLQGNVSLHILEECVLQRWKYFQDSLQSVEENGSNCQYQYIIEGSAYDNIGHFTLTYLSFCSGNQYLISSVLKHEVNLFYKRLIIGTPNSLRVLCKYILRFTRRVPNNTAPYIEVLENICRKLIIKHIADHVLNREHSIECNTYNLECHFTLCLSLIKKRLVNVSNGIAKIPCSQWIIFLKHIFRMHLDQRNSVISRDNMNDVDPRCRELILKLTQSISTISDSNNKLGYREIDDKSKYFPLCMKNLHNSLRSKHRLSHNDRFRYSLFLKDIGLPMQQSIYFWQQEYSKPSLHHSTCCHSWAKNYKKYIYGIRHLYGLEGSRKNYSMVKCHIIQSDSSNEGGCPFKHFDNNRLHNLLESNILTEDKWNQIQYLIDTKRSSEACTAYKRVLLNHLCGDETLEISKIKTSRVHSPVVFFNEIYLNMK